jgi:predicted TPR repeat methyltransferase
LFWYNDLDAAFEDMQAVTAKAETLDLNTGVYAWLRLGQLYDLKGQHEQAAAAYRETMRYAPGSEAAREARDFMASPYRR